MSLLARLKKLKILLVDDDEWIRDSLGLFFKSQGIHLTALESAEQGIDSVKRESYDIIISDYKLPGMNGLRFLRRIQEIQPNAMRMLITAYGSEEMLSEAKKIGVEDFIEKPFTAETIETSLARLIENHE